jgi:predicted RNase H-like HicB family nuclease
MTLGFGRASSLLRRFADPSGSLGLRGYVSDGDFAQSATIESMKHYTLPIIIERDMDGFFVSCSALQGCYTQGATYDEAIANIKDAIRLHLEDHRADHDELTQDRSVSLSTVEVSV